MANSESDYGPDVMGEPWPGRKIELLAGQTYGSRTIVTITSDARTKKAIVEYRDDSGTHYCTKGEFVRWVREGG